MLQCCVKIAILIVCISHFLDTCMYALVYGVGKHDDEDEIIQGVL
jgi:hypothetical protein